MSELGNAGEHGTEIDGDINRYLVDGYLPTIGIECHVQLNTNTKLFSSVDNDAREAEPNSKVSTIDYALPGMLPYLNHEASPTLAISIASTIFIPTCLRAIRLARCISH